MSFEIRREVLFEFEILLEEFDLDHSSDWIFGCEWNVEIKVK